MNKFRESYRQHRKVTSFGVPNQNRKIYLTANRYLLVNTHVQGFMQREERDKNSYPNGINSKQGVEAPILSSTNDLERVFVRRFIQSSGKRECAKLLVEICSNCCVDLNRSMSRKIHLRESSPSHLI